MKISMNWLKDFVDLDGLDVNEVWHRFTMSTAEVEEVVPMGRDIRNVVVGYVLEVKEHPSSKKLKVCLVDIGGKTIQSLCGAPNIRAGIKVPVALAGGSIKNIPEIRSMTVAGEASNGVICSAAEIGISDNHEGVLILPESFITGKDIREYIDIDDYVIEIDNKSITHRPDLWGHYGIARELAALFQRPLKPLDLEKVKKDDSLPYPDVVIEDEDKCYRYTSICIDNVKGGFTPFNMQVRLYYCGMRPISPIVDLTNYIMLELGQPMHAFDRRRVDRIVVRTANTDNKFMTLDGVVRDIPGDVLMICNNEKPVAIAGIMGGEESGIEDDTDSVFLEFANFSGASIRKSSMRLGLRTEASARFEKMIDPELTMVALERFVKLLRDMKPDIVISSNVTDVYPVKPREITIKIEKPYIDMYIGQSLDNDQIKSILESLEFKVDVKGDEFTVKVPTFRATRDITIKADIIEEITRIYGYDNITPASIAVDLKPLQYNEERLTENKIKEILSVKFGLSEVHSYIWYDNDFNRALGLTTKADVKLKNPHAKNMDVLRDSMVPSMLQMAQKNVRFFDSFGIFEIGSTFALGAGGKTDERKKLCILAAAKDTHEDELFYRLKGISTNLFRVLRNVDVEYGRIENPVFSWIHPVKSVEIRYGDSLMGYVTVVHPQIGSQIDRKLKLAVLEIDMPALHSIKAAEVIYTEPSRYPGVDLDFSFLVDNEVPYEKVFKDISGFDNDLMRNVEFIGIYTGKGLPENKKSMTFRVSIGSYEKTLLSEEIDAFSQGLIEYMKENGYTLR